MTFANRASFVLVQLLCVLLFATVAARAQQHQNLARGFEADKAYQTGEVDHVNLHNGNVSVTIPIGPEYKTAGSFAYRLSLVYNSKAWDWRVYSFVNSPGASFNLAEPGRDGNAGLGWQLSFGKIVAPNTPVRNPGDEWLYVSSDGAEHKFFERLHVDDAGGGGAFYTRDGSYLRLRIISPTQVNVDFPDGSVHLFRDFGTEGWRLERMSSADGNYLDIEYDDASPRRWILTDSVGREHFVEFRNRQFQDAEFKWLVHQVDLETYGGQRLIHEFDYQYVNQQRPSNHDVVDRWGPSTWTHRLTKVRVTSEGTQHYAWGMPAYVSDPDMADGRAAGLLRKLKFPTLGTVHWDYSVWAFPTGEFFTPGDVRLEAPDFVRFSPGVSERIVLDKDGTEQGRWRYDSALTRPEPNEDFTEMTTTVSEPGGHQRVHYFSAYMGQGVNADGAIGADYGYPYSVFQSTPDGLYISQTVEQANATCEPAGFCDDRIVWLRYERDTEVPAGSDATGRFLNQRMSARKTTYAIENRWQLTEYSNFDGLGHYRNSKTTSNFQNSPTRTEVVNYNPGNGGYPGSFTLPSSGGVWQLNDFNAQRSFLGGDEARKDTCFDSYGRLTRRRSRVSAASTSNSDLIEVFEYAVNGNLLREKLFGGDNQVIGSGGLCSLGLPSSPVYEKRHTYQHGQLATSRFEGTSHLILDRTIDKSSGLPSSSRDPAGLQTSYEYDALNRRIWSKPAAGHDAWVEAEYTAPNPSGSGTLPWIRVLQRPNGSSSGTIAESRIYFDEWGRVKSRWEQQADGSFSRQETAYDVKGQMTLQSTWQSIGTTPVYTRFEKYNPYGKASRIVPPEGAHHEVTIYNLGDRRKCTNRFVGTHIQSGEVQETEFGRCEEYDTSGRLVKMYEDDTNATYSYGPTGHLTQVKVYGGSSNQNRFFVYDGRGFLTREAHPESGAFTYSEIDAAGLAHRKRHDSGLRDLAYEFDAAQRLTGIRDRTRSGWPYVEQNVFATANSSGNWSKGKLLKATRINHRRNPFSPSQTTNFLVEETYTYGGRGGRPSYRETQVGSWTFGQRWSWDDTGQIEELTYPFCVGMSSACAESSAPTVSFDYTRGRLTSIPDFVDSITYHDNGMVADIEHSNGVVTWHSRDPHGIGRPANIGVEKPDGSTAELGIHSWDGSGHLVKRQTYQDEFMLYDSLNRLVEHRLNPGRWQSYAYDGFGNITSITDTVNGSAQTSSFQVAASSNRLLSTSTTGAIAYDAVGNMVQKATAGQLEQFEWDALDQMASRNFPAENYVYGPGGERIYNLRLNLPWDPVTIRDLDGRVLTRFEVGDGKGQVWRRGRDYVYRGSKLVAMNTSDPYPKSRQHVTLDHLGSTRLITDQATQNVAVHHYLGYGQDVAVDAGDERLRFTGHERDEHDLTGGGSGWTDDLDYMHARYYSPYLGRFLTTDPINSGLLRSTQSWNKYSYAVDNPMAYWDPNGEAAFLAIVEPSNAGDAKGLAGHAGLYVIAENGSAGISLYGAHDFKDGLNAFLVGYAEQGRQTRLFLLDTTPEQDSKMVEFLRQSPDAKVDRDGSIHNENCTTAVCNTLKAGEFIPKDSGTGKTLGVYSPRFLLNAALSGDLKVSREVLIKILETVRNKQEPEETESE